MKSFKEHLKKTLSENNGDDSWDEVQAILDRHSFWIISDDWKHYWWNPETEIHHILDAYTKGHIDFQRFVELLQVWREKNPQGGEGEGEGEEGGEEGEGEDGYVDPGTGGRNRRIKPTVTPYQPGKGYSG